MSEAFALASDNDAELTATGKDPMQPGIYFGLDEALYHADPSLGSGSIRALAKCPIYYWVDSHMNPLREPRVETEALLFGRALHKLVLEGLAAFQHSYRKAPSKEDYPEALITSDDIKAALKAVGEKVSGVKSELVYRLRAADPAAVIWDDLLDEHASECLQTGATSLKPDVYDRIVAGAGMIASNDRVRAAFQGGRPEVSIFWECDGVPMKARLDYVRLGMGTDGKPIGLITDLKSYANMLDRPPEKAVVQAIANTRLDIQAAAYLQGVALLPGFFNEGRVYGADGVNADWIKTACSLPIERWLWNWCFFEKDSPISMLRSARPGSAMIQAAQAEVARAQQAYRDNMQAFGLDWRFIDPILDNEVTLEDLPKWIGV